MTSEALKSLGCPTEQNWQLLKKTSKEDSDAMSDCSSITLLPLSFQYMLDDDKTDPCQAHIEQVKEKANKIKELAIQNLRAFEAIVHQKTLQFPKLENVQIFAAASESFEEDLESMTKPEVVDLALTFFERCPSLETFLCEMPNGSHITKEEIIIAGHVKETLAFLTDEKQMQALERIDRTANKALGTLASVGFLQFIYQQTNLLRIQDEAVKEIEDFAEDIVGQTKEEIQVGAAKASVFFHLYIQASLKKLQAEKQGALEEIRQETQAVKKARRQMHCSLLRLVFITASISIITSYFAFRFFSLSLSNRERF